MGRIENWKETKDDGDSQAAHKMLADTGDGKVIKDKTSVGDVTVAANFGDSAARAENLIGRIGRMDEKSLKDAANVVTEMARFNADPAKYVAEIRQATA